MGVTGFSSETKFSNALSKSQGISWILFKTASMKQSNSLKKLKIEEIISLQSFLRNYNTNNEKYIAHMHEGNELLKKSFKKNNDKKSSCPINGPNLI